MKGVARRVYRCHCKNPDISSLKTVKKIIKAMEILFELQVEKLLLGSQRQFSTQRQIEGVITGVLSAL